MTQPHDGLICDGIATEYLTESVNSKAIEDQRGLLELYKESRYRVHLIHHSPFGLWISHELSGRKVGIVLHWWQFQASFPLPATGVHALGAHPTRAPTSRGRRPGARC